MSVSYIYKITNIINGSIYVGQTTQKDIYVRFNQHLKEAKGTRSDMILIKAIRKYGEENFKIEELDRVSPHSQELLDEKEIYYIEKLGATTPPNYNMKTGGACGSNLRGVYGIDVARNIANDIKNTKKTFSEIASKHNVPPGYVSDINCGEIFPILSDVYPISDRNTKRFFSKFEIDDIYERLKTGENAMSIAEDYNVSNVSISNINNGLSYKRSGTKYPIYRQRNSSKRLSLDDVFHISELLKKGLSYYSIDRDYQYSRKTVSNIDKGKSYKKELETLGICDFPIKR